MTSHSSQITLLAPAKPKPAESPEIKALFPFVSPGIFNGASRPSIILSSRRLARRIRDAAKASEGDTPSNKKVRFLFNLAQKTINSELERAKELVREFKVGRHRLADGRRIEIRQDPDNGELRVTIRKVRSTPVKTVVTFRPGSQSGRVKYYLGRGIVETLYKYGTSVRQERQTPGSLSKDIFRLDITGQPVHEMRRENLFESQTIVVTALHTGGTTECATSSAGRNELELEPYEDRLSRYSTEDFPGLRGRYLESYDWFSGEV